MQLSGSHSKLLSQANGYTYHKAFTPLAHRNRSFVTKMLFTPCKVINFINHKL